MTELDLHTVIFLIVGGEFIISSALFALARGRLGETDALHRWAMATLANGAGWAFFGLLRGVVPDLLSILVGNGLLVLSLGLYLTIVAELVGRRIPLSWTVGLVAAQSALLAYFTLVTPQVAARIVVASACGAGLMVATGRVLLAGRPNRPVSDTLTAWMFLANGSLLVARLLYFLLWNNQANQSPIASGPVNNVMYSGFFITGIVLHFGFLMMLNDRYELRRGRAIADLEQVVREKEALLKEAHHRVKNNLQLVTSLMRLRAGDSPNLETKTVLADMRAKIQSVIVLNETLYKTGSYSSVNLAEYLGQVASHLVAAHNSNTEGVRLLLSLEPVELETRQVIPCGLIVNELITNSLKHAFQGGRSGEVRVVVERESDGRVRLGVSDNGAGLPEDFAARQGKSLGLQLVGDLTRQLRGTLEVGPGATFTIRFLPTSGGSGGHAIPAPGAS